MRITRLILFSGLFALLAPRVGLSALGDLEGSTVQDAIALKGARKKIAGVSYTTHVIVANGNTINEYVSPDGFVFAVTWRGISHPDLSVLLGSFYSEYQTALAGVVREKGRRTLEVRTSRMHFLRSGHMRDLHGRAYVPGYVPPGVDVGALP